MWHFYLDLIKIECKYSNKFEASQVAFLMGKEIKAERLNIM